MTETFDLASLAYTRWKRSVDLLVREVVRRRRTRAEESAEHARAVRRVRSLRRIVRKALSEYSRLQMTQTLSGPLLGPTDMRGEVATALSPSK
ncbi:MAG TPA: hypothetical protein VGO79_03385 [Thermoanaerobaculia bacterium]|jgi:hypothetical protein